MSKSNLTTKCLCFPKHYVGMLDYILDQWKKEGRRASYSLFFREMVDSEYVKIIRKELIEKNKNNT